MKVLFWNVRGIGNPESKLILKKLCALHNRDFLFIAEPWIAFDQLPYGFVNILKLKCFAKNDRSGLIPSLWCFCKESFAPYIIFVSKQQVSFRIDVD